MTFLFDIGNVLLKLHFDRFHRAIGHDFSSPIPETISKLNLRYEVGSITCEEFVPQSLEALESNLTAEQFTHAWEDIFSLNDPMWEVIRALKKQGHRLILFSNTNTIHVRYFLKAFPDFSLFDHHHFSQEVKARKPDAPFYQKAIDQYQLTPKETLYLDDLPENIATGNRLGFRSWQYDLNNHQACLDWLNTELEF